VATRIEGGGIKADPIGAKACELFDVIVQRFNPLIQWSREEDSNSPLDWSEQNTIQFALSYPTAQADSRFQVFDNIPFKSRKIRRLETGRAVNQRVKSVIGTVKKN